MEAPIILQYENIGPARETGKTLPPLTSHHVVLHGILDHIHGNRNSGCLDFR